MLLDTAVPGVCNWALSNAHEIQSICPLSDILIITEIFSFQMADVRMFANDTTYQNKIQAGALFITGLQR